MSDAVTPAATTTPAPAAKAPVTPAQGGGRTVVPTQAKAPHAGAQAPVTEESKAPPAKVKWKDKVNGQEVELEATEEDLRAAYRQRKSVHDTARQSAEERKAAQAERAAAAKERAELEQDELVRIRRQKQKDPNFDELGALTKYIQQQIERESEDPGQRALKEKDAIIQRMQDERKQEGLRRQEAQERHAEQQMLSKTGAHLMGALEQLGLPKSDFWLERTAMAHWTALEEKGLDLTPAELAAETKRETAEVLDQMAGGMDGEQLLNTFPEFGRKILAAALARHKAKVASGAPTPRPPPRQNVVGYAGEQPKRLTESQQYEADKAAGGVRRLRGL